MSKSNKGNLGKHFTEEHKQKMRDAAKLKPPEKMSMFGKKFSENHKEKIRESIKKHWIKRKEDTFK